MSTGDHAHDHPERLFGHNAAILALTLAERLAAGHPNVDPFVVNGVTIEQIADLVGHRTTIVTQKVYRHQLKPVISTGATVLKGCPRRLSTAVHGVCGGLRRSLR